MEVAVSKLLNILGIAALVLTLSIVLFPAGVAKATTVINVPGNYTTIQEAIDAASSGDTVQVAAGTYYENITLKDGVQVLGAGVGVTTIDGGGSGSVVTATNVGPVTKLDGFTITNGNTTNGGGMYNYSSSPTVTNCTFSGNSATYGGGMLNVSNSSPTVTNCTFSGNSATYGGGMYNHSSSPTVTNCILWDGGGEIYNVGSAPAVTYCDIQGGYSGAGNIDDDPLFVNPAAGDYHLQPGSPCIDAGNNAAPSLPGTDFEGDPRILDGNCDGVAVVDMGVDEVLKAATVIHVPGDYATIQAAIDAACTGDTVQVANGTYYEHITLKDGVQVLGAGAGVTTIDGGGSGSVVTATNVGPGTKLDGFTITHGSDTNGGGMCNYNSSPTLTNCTFSGNSAGDGGGMYNNNGSPTLTNCTFSGNSADVCGGMFNALSSPTLTNCTFSGNSAGNGGGGGMLNLYSSSPTLTNCTFSGNSAPRNGGGGMFNAYSSPTLTNCTFSGNSAGNGGGGMVNCYSSSPTLTDCTFSGNSATTNGGGGMLNYNNSSPTLTNCTFSGNTVGGFGGGMYNWYASSPTLTNCTFSGNSAYYGGGLYNTDYSSPTLTNCILWDGGGELYNQGSAPAVTNCDVQGGYSGAGNIDDDPLFVNPAAGDYHLQPGSPCIDAGDNAAPSLPGTDFEGDPRILDGNCDGVAVVDMGVDEVISEFTITASAGDHGSISPSGDVVECGGNQTFTISADPCYHIKDVLVDGQSVGAVSIYKFSDVEGNRTIAASFDTDEFTITASAGDHGSITPSGEVTVECGGNQTFIISADPCYHIEDVVVDSQSLGAVSSYKFTDVQGNHTIAASFDTDEFTITASAGAHGSISPSGGVTVECGGNQTFTISADTCYHIKGVMVDGTSVGAVSSYKCTDVEGNRTISASFDINEFNITASAGDHGSISPSGGVTVECGGNQTFAISPDTCCYIKDVMVDGQSVGAVSGYKFTDVTAGHTIAASFEKVKSIKTNIWVISSVNPSDYGQSVTFMAWVMPGSFGPGMPTGTVTFKDGQTPLGTGTLNGWGVATYSITSLSVGRHSITAVYDGNCNFNGSTSSALSQKVNKADTTTIVVSSLNPSKSGQSVTFTATVTARIPGSGKPPGTVTFKDGSKTLGTGTLNSSGKATYITTSLSVGKHSITAIYMGDSNFSSSTSRSLTQEVKRQ